MPLRFNVAGYSIDYEDIQRATGDSNIRFARAALGRSTPRSTLRHVAGSGFDLGLFVTNSTNKL